MTLQGGGGARVTIKWVRRWKNRHFHRKFRSRGQHVGKALVETVQSMTQYNTSQVGNPDHINTRENALAYAWGEKEGTKALNFQDSLIVRD